MVDVTDDHGASTDRDTSVDGVGAVPQRNTETIPRIVVGVTDDHGASTDRDTSVDRDTSADGVGAVPLRMTAIVRHLGWPASAWYRHRLHGPRRAPGPSPHAIAAELEEIVVLAAYEWPWWGYKRVAVTLRSLGVAIANAVVYRIYRRHHLLRRRRPQAAELHQALKLYELLPSGPDQLWQADVTYIEIPGHGWWYAVTVIDYDSRYLLACYLTDSFSAAEVKVGLDHARTEAERVRGGPLPKPPTLVTDNGVSFTAQAFNKHLHHLGITHVRIRYRTPQQLGLLERFHAVLKQEEVYWNLYASPADCRDKLALFRDRYNTLRPHWALKPQSGGDVVTPEAVYRGQIATTIPRWQGWAKDAKARLETKLAALAPKPATANNVISA